MKNYLDDLSIPGVDSMSSSNKLVTGNVLTQLIDGEMVILNLENEEYFTLDQIATRFWEVVLENGPGDAALETLLEEYEVERSKLEEDMGRWLDRMLELGLLVRA